MYDLKLELKFTRTWSLCYVHKGRTIIRGAISYNVLGHMAVLGEIGVPAPEPPSPTPVAPADPSAFAPGGPLSPSLAYCRTVVEGPALSLAGVVPVPAGPLFPLYSVRTSGSDALTARTRTDCPPTVAGPVGFRRAYHVGRAPSVTNFHGDFQIYGGRGPAAPPEIRHAEN